MSQFRYFDLDEFACKCGCGTNKINLTFVSRLDLLREKCGFALIVASGYRCENHPEEAKKKEPGRHHDGNAADLKVANGHQRYVLQEHAYAMKFYGIGPAKSFVHVDDRRNKASWVY